MNSIIKNKNISIPISIPIPIPIPNQNQNQNSPTKETAKKYLEYTLQSNIIDPSNSPPMCNFMNKLSSRIELYGCYNNSTNLDRV